MDNIYLIIAISILPFIFFLFFFFLIKRHETKTTEKLKNDASRRGWKYSKISDRYFRGHQITGTTEGISFTVESIRSKTSSSNLSLKTCLYSNNITIPDGLFLIGNKIESARQLPDLQRLSGFMGKLFQKTLEMMLGDDADKFSYLREIHPENNAFKERFMVWATDEKTGIALCSNEVEKVLMDIPKKQIIIIKINKTRLEIELKNVQLSEMDKIETIIGLAEAMNRAYKSI